MNKFVSCAVSAFRFFTLPASATCWLLLGGLVLFGWISQTPAAISLNISKAGTNAVVSWKQSGAVLQSATNLAGGWSDLSTASNSYLVQTTNAAQFFRLRQTSSTLITDIEPAYLGTSGGTFYIIGTHFSPGSVVLLNGAPAGSAMFVNSNLLMVTAGAFDPGTYNVSIVNAGQTNAVLANGLTVNATGTRDAVPPGLEFVHVSGLLDENIYDGAKCALIDLNIPSGIGPDFILARTYRSKLGPTNSPVGRNWDFSCNISVATNGADVVIHDGGGRADTFFRQPDGTYTRPEFFREGQFSNQVFTLTFADKSRWVFNALNAGTAPGKISQNIDRNGNALTYAYNGAGQLASVADALNRTNRFFYNGSGQLTNVTDFAGRTVTYTYDARGDLHSMTTPAITGTPNGNNFPHGKTVTYLYTSGFADDRLNHNLTAIIDNTGETVVTNQYSTSTNPAAVDFDRMVASALGTNPPTVFSYEPQTPSPGNRYATTKVYENDPVGNVTTTLFDSRNRPVQTRQFTGRATPGVAVSAVGNQPTGKLRAADPAYYETTIAYNLDSLPVQITEPRGNSVALVYAGDTNPATPVRERGNLLTLTQTPAPGVPSDQAQITEQFEYLPGFGTGEGAVVMKGAVHVFNIKVKAMSLPVRHTDPLGNVWNYSYDANGNLTSALPPGLTTGDSFEYNAVGQLTAHVHPADGTGYRQRDTFEYFTTGSSKGLLNAQVCGTDGWGGGGISGAALRTSYAYDAVGNVTNVVDPRGNDTQFVFNQLNQLMQVKSAPCGGGVRSQTDYSYSREVGPYTYRQYRQLYPSSASGRLIGESVLNFDSDGNPIGDGKNTTGYGYDAIGRLTSVTNEVSDASSTVTRYAYDANGQVTNVLSPLASSGTDANNRVNYSYDERGLPFQETAAPGSPSQTTTQYDYDANGNLSRVSEGLEGTPQVTTMEADGFVIKYTSSKGALFYRVRLGTDLPRRGIFMSGGGDRAKLQGAQFGMARSGNLVEGKKKNVLYSKMLLDGGGTGPGPNVGMNKRLLCAGCLTAWGMPTLTGGTGPITADTEMCAANPSALFRGRFMSWLSPSTMPTLTGGTGPITAPGDSGQRIRAQLSVYELNSEVGIFGPRTITDPLGNTTTNHFDACGNLVSSTDTSPTGPVGGASSVKLAETTYAYDALGRLTSSTDAILDPTGKPTGSAATSVALADNGQTTSVTDPLGHKMSYAYDSVGRLSSVTDPKGDSTTYTYDANGNVTGVSNRMKSDLGNADYVLTKSYGYDALNRCTNATDNAGNTDGYAYDSRGNLVRASNARGVVTQYEYDGLSRLTRSGTDMDGDGNAFGTNDMVTSQSWDANSRLATETDPKGNGTAFSYDALDRLTQTTLADGTSSHISYDVHGNPTSTTDANGTVVAYTYDGDNRLTRKDITPAAGVAATTTFEQYSYVGYVKRVVQATVNSGITTFTYDSLGDVLTETQNGLTVTNTYDAAGNRLTVTYPSGRQLAYTYEMSSCLLNKRDMTLRHFKNRCNMMIASGDFFASCGSTPGPQASYFVSTVTLQQSTDGDTPGLLATQHYLGDRLERTDLANGTQTLYSYNGGVGPTNATGDSGWGQISRIQHLGSKGSTLEDITYGYDAAQNVTGKSTSFSSVTTASRYQYDADDRLTNTVVTTNGTQTRNTSYTLDQAGNRLSVTGDAHPGSYTLSATTPEPADAQVNQYTTTPVGGFTYDKNGNRIAETSGATTLKTFSYDYANRLVAINSDSTGTPIAVYGYDALGRRILKGTPSGATYHTTRFVYDGDAEIEERDGSGTVIALIDHQADTLKNRLLRAIDASLVILRRNGTNYWTHTDADGSTVALTLDNGTVAERYNYADYGEPAFFDGSGNVITGSAVGNSYLFEGMQYDSESGLYVQRRKLKNMRKEMAREMTSLSQMLDPRTETTLQRGVGATGQVVQTRRAGKFSSSDGLRLD